MQRKDIPKLFKTVAVKYLNREQPKYDKDRFPIKEKQLQIDFAVQLMEANFAFRRERNYPTKNRKDATRKTKKIDFVVFDDAKTHIEIEQEGKWGDGFTKRTFQDLHKLSEIPKDEWGMFLALHIGKVYVRPKRETRTNSPTSFYISQRTGKKRKTRLATKWEQTAEDGLLKCNPVFWRWPYRKGCTVTVLTRYGCHLGNDRWRAN